MVAVNQEQRDLQEVSFHGEHLGDIMLQAVLAAGVGIQAKTHMLPAQPIREGTTAL